VRRLFWSWWPWALACLWNLVQDKWGWAFGMGLMALVCYLIAPVEAAPQYGLDHEFAIDDEEFLPTMAGATGEAFLPGNTLSILNNGDAFYPAMLQGDRGGRGLDHHRGVHLLGGRGRDPVREALAARAKAGVRVKILLDAVGSVDHRRRRAQDLEAGPCHLAWYNPLNWRRLKRYNHPTHRKSLIVDGASLHRRRRHRRSLARAGAASRRVARSADPDRRAGGHAAQTGLRAELAADHRRS
jgi:hypothetical protein